MDISPRHITELVLFFALGSPITGQNIAIDSGHYHAELESGLSDSTLRGVIAFAAKAAYRTGAASTIGSPRTREKRRLSRSAPRGIIARMQ
jgi:hypothetical protein